MEPSRIRSYVLIAASTAVITLVATVVDAYLGHLFLAGIAVVAAIWLFYFLLKRRLAHRANDLRETLRATERLANELRQERDRAQAVLDDAQVVILALDSQANVTRINHRGCKMLGYSEQDLLGKNWIETCIPSYAREEVAEAFHRIMVGDTHGFEYHDNPVVTRNGEVRMYAWHNLLLRDEDRIIGTLSSGLDITERKHAEEALQASEQRFRSAFETGPIGMALVSADGRFLKVNPAFCSITGYSAAELIQLGFDDITHPDDQSLTPHFDNQPLTGTERNVDFEGRFLYKSGETIWGQLNLSWVNNAQGKPSYAVAQLQDITDRKLAEQERDALQTQLQQAQKMEAIGHLTGGIAHDFNNILASILGYTGLALNRHVPDKDSKLAQYLTEVYTAGERARELVKQLLAFSRGGESKAESLLLQPLIKETAKMLRATFPATIDLQTRIDPATPMITGDPMQLHQALTNLCINARDAIEGTGHIVISLAQIEHSDTLCTSCHRTVSGSFVELSVSDTGTGLAAHQLPRIFEPFFTTKEVGKGSGMGLAVVHGIVHGHGGHITVDTTPQGTTFRLLFHPIEKQPRIHHLEDSVKERAQTPPSGKHILVVDDETALTRLLQQLLEHHGYRVTATNDPREALAIFNGEPGAFDLVISDQTMPQMTGADLAKQMLTIRPELAVILCTGYSDEIDDSKARALGVRAFLEKPMETQHLLHVIDQLLGTA